jgi:hypothetical protein
MNTDKYYSANECPLVPAFTGRQIHGFCSSGETQDKNRSRAKEYVTLEHYLELRARLMSLEPVLERIKDTAATPGGNCNDFTEGKIFMATMLLAMWPKD